MSSKRAIRRRQIRVRPYPQHPHFRPDWMKTCKDKQAFKTYGEAETAMEKLMASPGYDREPLNVYLCPINRSHYHYGHIIGLRRNFHGQETHHRQH
jgi:hypothetical protein